jgi:hypothetical protein
MNSIGGRAQGAGACSSRRPPLDLTGLDPGLPCPHRLPDPGSSKHPAAHCAAKGRAPSHTQAPSSRVSDCGVSAAGRAVHVHRSKIKCGEIQAAAMDVGVGRSTVQVTAGSPAPPHARTRAPMRGSTNCRETEPPHAIVVRSGVSIRLRAASPPASVHPLQ